MFRSYLRLAIRTLQRRLGYTLIIVVGLAVGIAVCLLITLYVRHELSYDDFHEKADRIHRIVSDWGDFRVPTTSWLVVRNLESDHSQIPVARFGQARRSGL